MLPNLPFQTRYTESRQLVGGGRINNLTDLLTSSVSGVVALAGGGYSATQTINNANVQIGTVANANDSLTLPLAKPGLNIYIQNDGANSANIFPQPLETINAGGAGAAIALAAGASALYTCIKTGSWKRFVSA